MQFNNASAFLVLQSGHQAGKRFKVNGDVYAIGRDSRCHLRPTDLSISPVHATIHFHEGAYYVKDQHSARGTFLNGERVDLARLSPGDTLRMGSLTLRFQAEVPAPVLQKLPVKPDPIGAGAEPKQPVAPLAPAPIKKTPMSWTARIYSLTMISVVALIFVGVILFTMNATAPAPPPPNYDPASASAVTLLYFYADW